MKSKYIDEGISGDLKQDAHPQRKGSLNLTALLPFPTNLGKLANPDSRRVENKTLFHGLVYNNH